MGAPKKEKKQSHTIMSLNKRIEILEEMVADLIAKKKEVEMGSTPREENSIQRVEEFNGEHIPIPETPGLKLTHADRLRSMDNAIRCLPPNYIVEGRHTKANISAICGFKVTDDMMDEIYSKSKHEGGLVVAITE